MSVTAFQGPFPSTWSSPPECTAISSNSIVGIDMVRSCLPRNFEPNPAVMYSPGTACPSGYTAQDACSRSTDSVTTTVTCCPVRGDMTMSCVADDSTLSSVWRNMFCTWSAGHQQTVMLVTTTSDLSTMTTAVTMTGREGINAYGLRMVYEARDVASTTPTTSESSPLSTASTLSGDSQPKPQPKSQSPTNELAPGAKAAIWATIPLVVLAALIGVLFFVRRRNQRRLTSQRDALTDVQELPPNNSIRPTNHFEMGQPATNQEFSNDPMSPLRYHPPMTDPQELPWPFRPAELPADIPKTDMAARSPVRTLGSSPQSEHPSISPDSIEPPQISATSAGRGFPPSPLHPPPHSASQLSSDEKLGRPIYPGSNFI